MVKDPFLEPPKSTSWLRLKARALMNERATNLLVFMLIIASVVLLFLEGLEPGRNFLGVAGDFITWFFLVELTIRCYAAQSRRRFFLHYSLDIVSLLPLVMPDYGLLRALRLLRLFRLVPLLAHTPKRGPSLLRKTFRQQLAIITVILVTVLGSTLALYSIDPGRFTGLHETFWWSLLSMIAGEPMEGVPDDMGTRLLTLVLMLGGLTVFALFTGTVSAVMADRLINGWSNNPMAIEDLSNHIIVCGWNRSGRVLLEEFAHSDDSSERPVVVLAEIKPEFGDELENDPSLFFLQGDYTTVEMLQAAGVKRASTAILLADKSIPTRSDQDRDARTILAALMIEKLNPNIFTCAELLSRDNEVHLRLAGIEEVVIGDDYSGTILATSSRVRGVVEIADEIFSNKYGNRIYKRLIRPEWAGGTFLQLQQRMKIKYDALLIAIEKAGGPGDSPNQPGNASASSYQRTETNPPGDYVFREGDRVIILAQKEPRW